MEVTNKMAKLTKAEQISRIPFEELGKLGGKEGVNQLKSYLKTLRQGYIRRVQSFKRRGVDSFAQIALEREFPRRAREINSLSRNQLLLEIAKYSKFFNDETSTLKGIEKVNKEQDIRIFGADKRGRPKRTMSTEERRAYWDLYNEFLNQNKNASSKYGSETIQQMLADITFARQEKMSFLDTLNALGENLEENLNQINAGSYKNVYSGRGSVE